MTTREVPSSGAGSAGPEALEEEDFGARVLEADVPVILVFTAEWCAPCKWLNPYLDAIAGDAGGRIRIYRMDADRSAETVRRYGVASVPTVVLVRSGEEVERSVGVEPERLRAWAAPFTAGSG